MVRNSQCFLQRYLYHFFSFISNVGRSSGCGILFFDSVNTRIQFVLNLLLNSVFIVYAHGRRLCSNWVRHGSTTTSYPQCSLTFMRERYLHRSFAYAKSSVGMDIVSVHKLFAYRVVSTVSTDIVSSHTKYCRIAYGITR